MIDVYLHRILSLTICSEESIELFRSLHNVNIEARDATPIIATILKEALLRNNTLHRVEILLSTYLDTLMHRDYDSDIASVAKEQLSNVLVENTDRITLALIHLHTLKAQLHQGDTRIK